MTYLKAITEIESQHHLLDLKVQEYPWIKEDKRSEYFKKIEKFAYPRKEKKVHSFDDINRIFGL
jgi:predicted TIM-barrel fold metal-dependent hydrolase